MGLLDDIIGPIKNVISDVESAVKEAVKLFGEVAKFLENVIETIKDVIEQITHLFNLHKIEYLFIHPFKVAAFTALSSMKELVGISIKAGGGGKEMLGDIVDGVEYPIKAVISKVKAGLTDLEEAVARLITKIKDEVADISYGIYAGFESVINDIESFPSYLDDFGSAIEKMFEVNIKKAYNTVIEFDDVVEKKVVGAKHEITSLGHRTFEPLDKFKQTVESRIKSESSNIDMFILIFAGLILGCIVGIYLLTKSVSTVVFVVAFLVILAVLVLLVELAGRWV